MDIRQPSAADKFYPAKPIVLKELIKNCFNHPIGPGKLPQKKIVSNNILGAVVPHAGYQYSGPVAANTYFEISNNVKPELIVIIGPNHWGLGSPVSIFSKGIWMTPLGKVEVDDEATELFVASSKNITTNNFAHSQDHCIEVQLPFLQYIFEDFKILPIILNSQDESTSLEIGRNLVRLSQKKDLLILASSDFTHYEPHKVAERKDRELINAIEDLDLSEFYNILERLNISACGYGAIATLMFTAKELGSKQVNLLKYATSGDITGDKSAVVGYASIIFK